MAFTDDCAAALASVDHYKPEDTMVLDTFLASNTVSVIALGDCTTRYFYSQGNAQVSFQNGFAVGILVASKQDGA